MDEFDAIVKDTTQKAMRIAAQIGITLDYTRESVGNVDALLGDYHDHLDEYDGDDGERTLWNLAVVFGIYIGEVMLRCGLAEKGFGWLIDDGLPIIALPDKRMAASPISKAHKRILNGDEDSIEGFVDVAFSILTKDELPKTGVLRVPDVETASGSKLEAVVYKEADYYINLVAEGKEDFVIFKSHDGFFQFYGVGDRFVCEAWFNNGGRRAYGMINPDCANTERVDLVTPFGKYTPRERDIISLEQLKTALREYFYNFEEADFLAKVPHEEIEG